MNKCDVCGLESENVLAGRWLFYCPEHKQNDLDKTMENEIIPDLENGDLEHIANDGYLMDIVAKFGL